MADKQQVLGSILNYFSNQQNAKDARVYDREKTSRTFAQQDDLAKSNKEFQLSLAEMEKKYATERDIAIQQINADRDADNKAWQVQMQEMTNNLTSILNQQRLDHEEALLLAKEKMAQQRMVLGSSLATGEYEAKSNIQMEQADDELDRMMRQTDMLDAYAKDKADKSFTFPTTNYQLGLAEKETSGWFNPLDDSDMTKYLKSGLTQFTSESRPGSGITVIEQMGRIARKENPTDRELSQLKIGQDYLKDLYKEANQKGYIDDYDFYDDTPEKNVLVAIIGLMKEAGIDEDYFKNNPLKK